MILFFLTFFILGILVGSFLNVVLFRMERDEDFVKGRSRCLHCHTNLAWFDNIPLVSFVLLKGRCRYCQAAISYQYPLVEFFTGFLFVLAACLSSNIAVDFSRAIFLLWALITICFAVLIFVYDLRFSSIPLVFLEGLCLTLFCYGMGAYFFRYDGFLPDWQSSLWGMLISGGFFFALVFFSKETWMGWGDVWIGAWAGGLLGIELVQVFITLSFSLGALVGLTLLYQRKKNLKSEVPFAPYLLLSALLILGVKVYWPSLLSFLSPWFLATI